MIREYAIRRDQREFLWHRLIDGACGREMVFLLSRFRVVFSLD
jgi:hypothetical protein